VEDGLVATDEGLERHYPEAGGESIRGRHVEIEILSSTFIVTNLWLFHLEITYLRDD